MLKKVDIPTTWSSGQAPKRKPGRSRIKQRPPDVKTTASAHDTIPTASVSSMVPTAHTIQDHPADEGRLEKQLDTEIKIKGEEEAAVKAENKVELEKQEAESPQSQRGTPDIAGSPQNKAEGLYFVGSVFLLCPLHPKKIS